MKAEDKLKKQIIIVKGLVVDSDSHILMVQRNRAWHKESHGKWEFPGGKIYFGETPEEACIRETEEESGIGIKIDYLIPKIYTSEWTYPDRETQQIISCYKCTPVGGEISLEDHGVSDVKWLKLEDILKLEVLPRTHEFLRDYMNGK